MIAILDACVLYPAPLRSLLIYFGLADLYSARWTEAINNEWMRNVVRDYPDVTQTKVERVRDLMVAAIPESIVTNYEHFINTFTLPDPDDRHVLAAAIQCQASVIVTANLKDFPVSVLGQHGVVAMHPDEFVCQMFDTAPDSVCDVVETQRLSLRNPPKTIEELLETFEAQGLKETVARLRTRLLHS